MPFSPLVERVSWLACYDLNPYPITPFPFSSTASLTFFPLQPDRLPRNLLRRPDSFHAPRTLLRWLLHRYPAHHAIRLHPQNLLLAGGALRRFSLNSGGGYDGRSNHTIEGCVGQSAGVEGARYGVALCWGADGEGCGGVLASEGGKGLGRAVLEVEGTREVRDERSLGLLDFMDTRDAMDKQGLQRSLLFAARCIERA